MKFLVDQDVYSATARFIGSLGHDVLRVAEVGLSQAADQELLQLAQEQGRIFVTRDRDFGNLVFTLPPAESASSPRTRYTSVLSIQSCPPEPRNFAWQHILPT